MANTINAGLIGLNMAEDFFTTSTFNEVENLVWKKIYTKGASEKPPPFYPAAEIVNDFDAIVNDADITLVFVSSEHLHLIKPVLDAGKLVRVI